MKNLSLFFAFFLVALSVSVAANAAGSEPGNACPAGQVMTADGNCVSAK